METAVRFAKAAEWKTAQGDVPVAGVASAIALAAVGSLLVSSLFSGRRRLSVASKFGLGALALCAGVVMWTEREHEATAARHLLTEVGRARDARWLKRHPIDFG